MKDLEKENMTKILTLIFFLEFILMRVVANAQHNKMTILNISICLAPCLMKSLEPSPNEIIFAKKSVEVVKIML